MLVLSRKVNEVTYIGDNIRITVTDIDRHKIRLGICAPPDVRIMRGELLAPDQLAEMESRFAVKGKPENPASFGRTFGAKAQ